MTARLIIGDVFDGIASLDDSSIDLCLSSPPFLALRSYLPADHPDKGKEIGSEPTPEAFIDTLLDVVEALTPKLAEHGSLCFELGDTYSGSGGAGGDYLDGGLREGQPAWTGASGAERQSRNGSASDVVTIAPSGSPRSSDESTRGVYAKNRGNTSRGTARRQRENAESWPLAKSLCLIPESFRWALVYGRNPFNGRATPRWRARNVVRWSRSNPPVGSLGDKWRPGTSDIVVACKSGQRYFDLDAVRGHPDEVLDQRHRTTNGPKQHADPAEVLAANYSERVPSNPNGAPPLDWWNPHVDALRAYFGSLGKTEQPSATKAAAWLRDVGVIDTGDTFLINAKGYEGSHYAVYPERLCIPLIESMTPRRVCRVCGEPSRRIVGPPEYHQSPNAHGSGRPPGDVAGRSWDSKAALAAGKNQSYDLKDGGVVRVAETLGWSDCGHNDYRPGVVLDPFAGSGTTLAVATSHGRDAIGIDIDERNAVLARERCGLFLEVLERVGEQTP